MKPADLDRLLRSASKAAGRAGARSPVWVRNAGARLVARAARGLQRGRGPHPILAPDRRDRLRCPHDSDCCRLQTIRRQHEPFLTANKRIRDRRFADPNGILGMNNALKWKLAFAFLLVFIAGITTGAFLGVHHLRGHFLGPPNSGDVAGRMREHFRRALDLTSEQESKIAPIIDATTAKLEAIRIETAERVRTVMEESKKEVSRSSPRSSKRSSRSSKRSIARSWSIMVLCRRLRQRRSHRPDDSEGRRLPDQTLRAAG